MQRHYVCNTNSHKIFRKRDNARHLTAIFDRKQWKAFYVCNSLLEWRTRVLWYIRKDISLQYVVPTFRVTLSKISVLLFQNTLRHSPEDDRPTPNMSRLENTKIRNVRNDIND